MARKGPDAGHKLTDEMLEKLEKQIAREYRRASEEVKQKLTKYLEKFAKDDAKHKAMVEAGTMSESDYAKWRLGKIKMGERWKEIRDTLAQDYANVDKITSRITSDHLMDVYALNYNYGTYEIENGAKINTSFSLYDHNTVERLIKDEPKLLPNPGKKTEQAIREGKIKRWSAKKIDSVMTQSILQGESIPQIAQRLSESVGEIDSNAAIRAARTMTTAAESAGRVDSYERAEDMGIEMEQVWIATLDDRTRHEHRLLNGQRRKVGEPFEVNGEEIEYPGDPNAEPYLVYNCRCTLIAAVKGTKVAEEMENVFKDAKIGDMTYEEWRGEKEQEQKQEQQEQKQEQQDHIQKAEYSTVGLNEPRRPRKTDFSDEDEYYTAREQYRIEHDKYNQRIDEIVNEALEFERFESKDEVIEWAEHRGVTIDNNVLDKIDLRAFNETSTALDEMFERFPEVVSYEFEDFDGSIGKTSFNIGLTNDGLLSANGGFNFNPRLFADYANGLKDALGSQTDGYFVVGDGTFSAVVRHEYGHNVQSYIENKIALKYHAHADDWRKNFSTFDEYKGAQQHYREERHRYEDELRALIGLNGSSEYSNTNNLELFAEGFSEWASGGKTEFGIKFGEFLQRWY